MAAALSSVPAVPLATGRRRPPTKARGSVISAPTTTRSDRFPCLGSCRYATGLHQKSLAAPVFLLNANPSDADTAENDTSGASSADGPPLLTILAGALVFLLVCFMVGSIVMWLVGLIVNVPSSR